MKCLKCFCIFLGALSVLASLQMVLSTCLPMPPLSNLHHAHKRLGRMIAIILRIFHMLFCKAYVTYSVHDIISFT